MLEKKASSQILVALGMTPKTCGQIFLVQGAVLAALGIFLGACLGILGAILLPTIMEVVQDLTGFSVVSGSYFKELPVELRLLDTVVILGAAMFSSLIVIALAIRSATQRSGFFDLK